jgi:hypothetical protein
MSCINMGSTQRWLSKVNISDVDKFRITAYHM